MSRYLLTKGNTGISLAMIGVIKGYKVEIVMSEAVSIERQKMLKAFSAKLTLTPAEQGTDGAIKKARKLVNDFPDKYFMPDQFSNEYNKLAHYKTTAEEIWKQTNGQIFKYRFIWGLIKNKPTGGLEPPTYSLRMSCSTN